MTPKEAYFHKLAPENMIRHEFCLKLGYVQSGAAYRSLGFEDGNLGSSPGWWASTVASYCPSRPAILPKFLSSKPCDQ